MTNMEVKERVTRKWLDRWENYLGSGLRFAAAGSRKVSERGTEAVDMVGGSAATSGVWASTAAAAAVAPASPTPQSSAGLVAISHEDRDREMAMTMSVVSSNGNTDVGNRRGRQMAATVAGAAEREITTRRKRRGGGLLWRQEVAVAHVEEDIFQESGPISTSMTTCWVSSTDTDDAINGFTGCGGMGGGGGGAHQLKKLFAMASAVVPAGAAATKQSIMSTATSTPLPLPYSAFNDQQGEEVDEESACFSLPHAGVSSAGSYTATFNHHHRHATTTTITSNNNLVGIDSLSDLALATIFSHLSSQDLGNVSLVCKRWCDLADHTRTHLKLKISNLCPQGVDSMSSSSNSDTCQNPDELLHRLLMRWPSLTHVEFNCVQSSPMRTPGRYRSRLDFGNQTMDLLGMICGPRLQELVLIECLHIDASSIATCLGRCKNLKRLHIERLNLRGCFHGAGAFACYCSIEDKLIDAISDVDTLTHLWIEGCTGQITSGQLSRLLSTPNLESLALDVKMWPWPEILTLEQGGAGGGSVGSDAPTPSVVFPPNNKMKELTWISLHPMYYPNFVTLTVSCTKLETLNLSCCILEAGIMGVVMRELSKGLLALRLMNCSFGGHSLLPFPEVLCPKLKELQIVGTSGAADIQCIAESCPALRRLVVEEPEIMMLQERHVSCGCGLGSAIYRLASRARRALRVRSRRLSNRHHGGVF